MRVEIKQENSGLSWPRTENPYRVNGGAVPGLSETAGMALKNKVEEKRGNKSERYKYQFFHPILLPLWVKFR